MQGTQEHGLVSEPQLLSCRRGMKRKGQAGAGVEEGRERLCGCLPPHPGSTSRPWTLPLTCPGPLGVHLLSCFWPQWLFLLPPLWFSYFGGYSSFGFPWYSYFLFGLTYFPLTDSGLAHTLRASPNLRGGREGVHRERELGAIESLDQQGRSGWPSHRLLRDRVT